MWVLHLLPTSFILYIVYAALGIGAAGFLVSSFLRSNPYVNIYRIPLQLIFVSIFVCGIYWYGGYSTELIWRKQVEELEAKVKVSEEKAPIITKQIVTKYKDKIVIVGRQVDVIKKEIEIKREIINEGCKLNPTAVEMYNKGITGPYEGEVK